MTAEIGHNMPPASEAFSMAINDLFTEAKNFLDGQPIADEGQADAYTAIMDGMKELLRDAEKTRKAEKEPFLVAGREVDERWKAATAPAQLTVKEIAKPLTVWREAQQAIKDAETAKLREEGAQKEKKAQAARESAISLEDAEKAEEQLKRADIAKKTANKIDRSASGMRTSWVAEVTDPLALGKWAWLNRRDEYTTFLEGLAKREINLAKAGQLPGVNAVAIKTAT